MRIFTFIKKCYFRKAPNHSNEAKTKIKLFFSKYFPPLCGKFHIFLLPAVPWNLKSIDQSAAAKCRDELQFVIIKDFKCAAHSPRSPKDDLSRVLPYYTYSAVQYRIKDWGQNCLQ